MPRVRGHQNQAADPATMRAGAWRMEWPVWRFMLVFAVIAGAGFAFEYYCMRFDSARTYRALVASGGAFVSRLVGYEVHSDGTGVIAAGRPLEVTPECAALDVTAVFIAGVLAFPTSGRRRMIGLTMGLVGIFGFNILRIAVLSGLAAAGSASFDKAHVALMHVFPLAVVLPLWLAWLLIVVRPGGALAEAGATAGSRGN